MNKYKWILIAIITFCVGGLCSCSGDNNNEQSSTSQKDETKTTVFEVGGWKITYEDLAIESSLQNVSEVLGYSDVSTSEINKEASEGKKFCLIKLVFEKVDSNEEVDWTKIKLTDDAGNEYTRIDDSFLNDLSMKRIPGTNLNFGTNEGWIAFEINEDAQNLSLIYPFSGDELNIKIN